MRVNAQITLANEQLDWPNVSKSIMLSRNVWPINLILKPFYWLRFPVIKPRSLSERQVLLRNTVHNINTLVLSTELVLA